MAYRSLLKNILISGWRGGIPAPRSTEPDKANAAAGAGGIPERQDPPPYCFSASYYHYTFRYLLVILLVMCVPLGALAQEESPAEEGPSPEASITTSSQHRAYVGQHIVFDISGSQIPEGTIIEEVLWDFGDGVRTTGQRVSHSYAKPGTYLVKVAVQTDRGAAENTSEIEVFEHVALLIADGSAPDDQLEIKRQQAAKEGLLLLVLRSRGGGPEALVEEELSNTLLDARAALAKANLLITWTSGSVGPNVLSKFSQRIHQRDDLSFNELDIASKGIIILSDTPFGVLAPSAQAAFDQLSPLYVLLSRPQALDLLLRPLSAEEAEEAIFNSPTTHRLLGTFSARTVEDISITNFLSFGVNFLVNRGVPINNITLVLMLPVIATILSFSRQVLGIKAFGLVTPTITTLSFLVMGLRYGLIVFSVMLLAGTATRLLLRRLHLLYLPRMALVLTNTSFAILVLFGIGILTENTALLTFSIFPILILTLLAEEFIAVQFKSGAKKAFIITAWTLALAIGCYFIVSWELLRTIIISYPEVVLLALPINILLGRWTGLRVTEYFRFRKLLPYV